MFKVFLEKNKKIFVIACLSFLTLIGFTKIISASSQANEKAEEITQLYRTCQNFCQNQGNTKYKISNNECLCYSVSISNKKKL